ncbi:MAG TPA: hypothetical protein VJ697_09910, partial [Nitrososphaeraceae archaeon]|nr:hypothetical protein [Nitrososphaeraceae archaeon]
MSLPDEVKQKIIISDEDIETAKKCILFLKYQLLNISGRKEIGESQDDAGDRKKSSNPVWIPYGPLLGEVFPAEKGPDMRILQRLLSFLNIIPLAKMDYRQKLVYGNKELIIANLEDLAEVLHITQNISGIPSYKVKFYKEIFLPLFKFKSQPDEKDGTKEKIIAVTTKELADHYKKMTGKNIGVDNLRKKIIVELINNDYLGEIKSELDKREYLYYPLIEFDDTQNEIILNEDIKNNETNISKLSNKNKFDNFLHVSPIRIPKNCKNIKKEWLIYEILGLARYRIDLNNFSGPLADFINNHEEFQLLDINRNRLKIKEFIDEYEKDLKLIRYFSKPESYKYHNKLFGNIKLLRENEDKSCEKLSNSSIIDNKGNDDKGINNSSNKTIEKSSTINDECDLYDLCDRKNSISNNKSRDRDDLLTTNTDIEIGSQRSHWSHSDNNED